MRFFLLIVLLYFLNQPAWAEIRFLTISDFHYGANPSLSDAYDADEQLLNLAFQKYNQLSREADFMITLGDFPVHSFWYDKNKKQYIKTVFHGLYAENVNKKPLFYVTGNNDSLKGNYRTFVWKNQSPISIAEDWKKACIHCEGLIVDEDHMLDEGYYSTYVLPGNKDIFLIALNSVQFAKTPFYIAGYPHQNYYAFKQLQWLEKQLKTHQSKQLLIAMHIPPGNSYKNQSLWKDHYLKQFLEILKQYHHQYGEITLLTAHTHMDDIRKIQLPQGNNIYAYATPSISRLHHNYPGIKIFSLNKNLQINNYTTYYTSMKDKWRDEHYQAIDKKNSVFPQCLYTKQLSDCLNSLSDEEVCQSLNKSFFYGVKSPRVDHTVCKFTYPIPKH